MVNTVTATLARSSLQELQLPSKERMVEYFDSALSKQGLRVHAADLSSLESR